MIAYDKAVKLIIDSVKPLPPVELPLSRAVGRVSAETIRARWDSPPADNSAMDGYAFSSEYLPPGRRFKLAGASYAGHPYTCHIDPGQAVKITTGAPLPPGTDTVVPFEETQFTDEEVVLDKEPCPGRHVRARGEEYRKGEVLVTPGSRLRAGDIGLLASAGITQLKVYPKPRVGLLSTGDELVELGEKPGPGQIINSNLYLLSARIQELNFESVPIGIGRDSADAIADGIRSGLKTDLILSTGGVSVGEKDYVHESLIEFGFEKSFWKVAIKPGKPVLFGSIGETPFFGLPGNPAASAATFELFVKPALFLLAGHPDPLPSMMTARLTRPVTPDRKRRAFLWGVAKEKDSEFSFEPSDRQKSGQNKSIQAANALMPLPAGGEEWAEGTMVKIMLLYL